MRERPFSRQGNSGLEKLNTLPQLTWMVRAFLHRAWQSLALSPWFCHYARWLFNPQSGAMFWAKPFRRKTNLSEGRVANNAQSFEIIKTRQSQVLLGETYFPCHTWTRRWHRYRRAVSVCQENILEMIMNFFFLLFPWSLPGTIIHIRLFSVYFLREGYYAESTEQRSMWHGSIKVSQGLEGPVASRYRVSLPVSQWEGRILWLMHKWVHVNVYLEYFMNKN